MNVRKYAESHEWVLVQGDIGTVGISDHAQEELTSIVFVEPPKAGTQLIAKQPAAIVESVKAASDVYSPVSGEVIEANAALEADPGLLNTDPYGAGWIYKVRLTNPAELEKLFSEQDYQALIARGSQ
ncbi:MAG: glycine cleavage system protein H [Verrucomicrobia bacterium]|nr:MAG: glycine cleavage system protein H [Verrucomicrobiota bacterium]